jgi:hypothetical protein
MIQISTGPQPSPVCTLHRFCRLKPIHPFAACRQVILGLLVAWGVGVAVALGIGDGVLVSVGVFEGVGLGVWVDVGVAVCVCVVVGVAGAVGVFVAVLVAVGTCAVSVAAAASSTATWVATGSGVAVGSPAQAAKGSKKASKQNLRKESAILIAPLSSWRHNGEAARPPATVDAPATSRGRERLSGSMRCFRQTGHVGLALALEAAASPGAVGTLILTQSRRDGKSRSSS